MVRPIVIMAEMEPPEGLSARKLVLETGKFNVITAYSVKEALDTIATFPDVHGVVLHASICKDSECERVIAQIKKTNPKALIVALVPSDSSKYKGADHTISSHEPQELLNLLRSKFGDPRNQQPAGKQTLQA